MPELSLVVHLDGDARAVVEVSGEVDMATAPQLEQCLCAHADRELTLDLSGVGFFDSSGIAAVVRAYRVLRDAGHSLRITGEQDNVRTVLDIAGLTTALHAED